MGPTRLTETSPYLRMIAVVGVVTLVTWIYGLAQTRMPEFGVSTFQVYRVFSFAVLATAPLAANLYLLNGASGLKKMLGAVLLLPTTGFWLVLGMIPPLIGFDVGGWPRSSLPT